jgi:hypothetical protein
LRKLAKISSTVCFIISAIGIVATTLIHLSLGGDLDNLMEFATGYVIACVVVALAGLIFLFSLKSCASSVEKTQMIYAQNADAIFKKIISEENATEEIDKETEVKLYAKAVETMLLKTPSTAKFCTLEEMIVINNNEIYQVSGYVDSQNSYGAMIRTPFTFNIKKENGTWKFVDNILSPSATFIVNFLSISFVCVFFGILMTLILYFLFSNIL